MNQKLCQKLEQKSLKIRATKTYFFFLVYTQEAALKKNNQTKEKQPPNTNVL